MNIPTINNVGNNTNHQLQAITLDSFNPINIAVIRFIKNKTISNPPFISYIPNSFLMNHIPSNASNHSPPLVITNPMLINQNINLPITILLYILHGLYPQSWHTEHPPL